MKYNLLILTSIVFVLLGVFFVSGSVTYLHNNIRSNYTGGDKISGRLNINIANHKADALFTSNFPGNITLLELLKLSDGVSYSCTVNQCLNSYQSIGTVNQIQLNSQGNIAGFGLNGPGITINSAKLTISSNAPSSCSPNLYIDFLADGLDVITSDKSSGESCGVRHSGCYDSSNTAETTMVTGKEYCEKIRIPAGPSFIVGGKIRMGNGNSNLTMKIYNFDTTDFLGSCRLPQNTENLQELNCVVNYSSAEVKDYYVCISTGLNNNYKIGAETSSPTCGTAQGFGSLDSDIDVFAETMRYAANPSFTINQTTYSQRTNDDLDNLIENYIQNKYNSDCQPETCFIPISFYGADQDLVFSDYEMNYESVGLVRNSQDIYRLSEEPPKITATNVSLDISKANFTIPVESSESKFKLYLDNSQIFDKDISVKKSFLFDIDPKIVPFGKITKFTASSNKVNITNTIWNFGDGTQIQTVNGSSTSHAFTQNNASFDIEVTAISNQTQAVKKFKIFVGNPKDVANMTIIEYKRRLANITQKIDSYPAWTVQRIKDIVYLNNMTSELNTIELFYNNATTETDYQNAMLKLIKLDVPYSVSSSLSGNNLPLSIGYDNINVNYIEKIDNKDVLDNEALKDQIVGWMDSNFNPTLSFTKIEKASDSDIVPILTLFKITTNPSSGITGKVYLILGNDISSLGLYQTNYNHLSLPDGVDYIVLDNSRSQTFEFLVEGDIDAETLGAYISPSISVLGDVKAPTDECNLNNICDSGETSQTCPEDCSTKWFKFTIIGWVMLILGAFVAYIILQEWYKRNYQKSLFSEPNDLYNLINFIYNARKSGLEDGDIRSKLKDQKWSNERINFAFKKIDGKRIGMLEIPLFKSSEHKQVVKQIANRQPNGIVNARFIKRPY